MSKKQSKREELLDKITADLPEDQKQSAKAMYKGASIKMLEQVLKVQGCWDGGSISLGSVRDALKE